MCIKKFHASKSAASDHVSAKLEETFSRAEWQQLSWTTCDWSNFANFPLSHLRAQWDMKFHSEVGGTSALWDYYESRLWSESGNCLWGNVKVSKISSTSKGGVYVWEDSFLNWNIVSEGRPRCCLSTEGPVNPLPFCPKGFSFAGGQSSPSYQAAIAWHLREIEALAR